MLFHDQVFCPHLAPDGRVREVLARAVAQAPEPIRPSDLLAAVLWQGDEEVLATLAQALQPGRALQEVLDAIRARQAAAGPVPAGERCRDAFTREALCALDAFAASFPTGGRLPEGSALDVLLTCILRHLDSQERRDLAILDADQATALFCRRAVEALTQGAPGPSTNGEDEEPRYVELGPSFRGPGSAREPPLVPPELAPSEDLTRRAQEAAAPEAFPFDGEPLYERLFDQLARALHRRQARHVLLTGERGVGKSTVVAELARRAAAGHIPFLAGRRFLSISCRYFPPDESRPRLAALLAHLAGHPEVVACLDGLAALLRGERGTSNKPVLLAALAHARCQLIGLVTPHDYEELIADDPDYADFFSRVDVEEPNPEVALRLLRHFARGLEDRFGVIVDDEAVRQAVLLSAGYILNDQLPAKALRLLHRACEDLDYERSRPGGTHGRVTAEAMVRAVSQASGVPEETLRGVAERSDYEQGLREVVLGQDHAVREVATELGLIKAGMTDPDKPASVMLFLGQTGTGKTEMAKALARFYSTSKRLKTYTLGNCVEPHSVATIIGVPPGYVGNDRGGRLVNELNADPYCVFLLDEADKAHPDVLQPFLNLFDEGWVCDQRGVRAYANKSIFILTTNVGQRMIAEMVEQGRSQEEIRERMKEALSQIRHTKSDRPVFTPEFLARIKRIIVFNPLSGEAMRGIARKLVAEMREMWQEKRGKVLAVPEALVEYLGEQAHRQNEKSKGKEGGRLVRKLLAEWVEARLQRAITERPQEYRQCATVILNITPPEPDPLGNGAVAPEVTVRFGRQGDS
jgi:ATP-dependent Clp protease ATP-binding subunit ClpA